MKRSSLSPLKWKEEEQGHGGRALNQMWPRPSPARSSDPMASLLCRLNIALAILPTLQQTNSESHSGAKTQFRLKSPSSS